MARYVMRVFAVLVGLQLAVSVLGDRGLLALRNARQDLERLRADVSALHQLNAGMREQIRRLQTDPLAIEELARREYGFAAPGEVVFTIRDVPAR